MAYFCKSMLKECYERTIPGKLFKQLRLSEKLRDILIFGCGYDPLPRFLAAYTRDFHIDSSILGYDKDRVKIGQHLDYERNEFPNLSFSFEIPKRQFETVLAINVLHENPERLCEEVKDFTLPGGFIGVLDYDMKEYSKSRVDFFQRWGRQIDEKTEREKIGNDEAFAMHTKFGLEDCIKIFNSLGTEKVASEGKIKRTVRGDVLPTEHFIYVGRKD